MRLWIIFTIFRKELLETIRDRRTFVRVLVLPILLYPLLAVGTTKLQSGRQKAQEARASIVAVWGDLPEDALQRLNAKRRFTFKPWEGASDEARALVAGEAEGLGEAAEPKTPPGASAEPAAGAPPAGAPPAGAPPAGAPPAGAPPAGEPPAGEPPAGAPPTGEAPAFEPPANAPPVEPPGAPPAIDAPAQQAAGEPGSPRDDGARKLRDEDRASGAPRRRRAPRGTELAGERDPLLPHVRAALEKGAVDAILVVTPSATRGFESGGALDAYAYVDALRDASTFAAGRLDSAAQRSAGALAEERERARGLPEGFGRGISIAVRDTTLSERRSGEVLGTALPMLLIAMSLLGVFLPAVDITAGEKERGTMQTLLCAPLEPFEIMAGKLLTVWCVSFFMALANITSFALTVGRILPDEVPVPVWTYAATLGLLVPVTGLFSALFLSVASFAKDFKDGQNILMPVYLPCTLLGSASLLPGIELDRVTALVPIVNVTLLIKGVFLQRASAELVFLVVASNIVYALLALTLAARVFAREELLLGGKESTLGFLGLDDGAGNVRKARGGTPSPAAGLAAFAWVLVVAFYGGSALERLPIAARVAAIQLACFLAPVLALAFLLKLGFRETFAAAAPRPLAVAGALLLGTSAWVVSSAAAKLAPPPPEFVEELGKQLGLDGASLPVLVLVIAVLPALCEELVFRGFVFAGLRRLGPWVAVVGTAVLFGLAHGSVYRMLPTTLLGLVLGGVRERTRSIAPGMLIHVLNNGILIVLWHTKPDWMRTEVLPGVVYAVGTLVVLAGGALVWASPRKSSARDAVSGASVRPLRT